MKIQAPPLQISRLYPSRFMAWQQRSLSVRAASVVSLAGCDTVEEITRLGRSYFEGRPNCAAKTLAELSLLAGWPPEQRIAVYAIAGAVALSIADPEETHEIATDVVISLRRSGFVITTKPHEAC